MANTSRFRATFKLANPDVMDATMTVTMNIGDWKQLRDQLNATHTAFPAWKLRDAIGDLVRRAEQDFEAESEVST
jgi:hypothetical protein